VNFKESQEVSSCGSTRKSLAKPAPKGGLKANKTFWERGPLEPNVAFRTVDRKEMEKTKGRRGGGRRGKRTSDGEVGNVYQNAHISVIKLSRKKLRRQKLGKEKRKKGRIGWQGRRRSRIKQGRKGDRTFAYGS